MSVIKMKNNAIAAFTSYNPDIALLERAVFSIRSQVAEVLIVDNGSTNADEILELALRVGARFISLVENQGIATAFNVAFRYAKNEGYEWVLTCDQDSVMADAMVDRFQRAKEVFVADTPIGIVCPNFYNRTTRRLEYDTGAPRLIDCCISSGSLTLVAAWDQVAGFDEAMFIDGVDFEFCDRLHKFGYGIHLVPDVHMEHEIGLASLRGIFGHKFLVLNHSAFRKFYISQNIIYRDGKAHGGYASVLSHLKVLKQALLVIAFEDDKKEKLTQIFHGLRTGRKLLKEMRNAN